MIRQFSPPQDECPIVAHLLHQSVANGEAGWYSGAGVHIYKLHSFLQEGGRYNQNCKMMTGCIFDIWHSSLLYNSFPYINPDKCVCVCVWGYHSNESTLIDL